MPITIALVGNPNSGKTTLFNALTGSNQHVGNWPGVTVEKKEGKLKGSKDVSVMDLPGIYSLSPYTLEEVVSRNYLIDEKPDIILNIVDGTNLERNLFLTTQLIELGMPVVCAINMMDVVNRKGDKIDTEQLQKSLGCRVVEISALKGTGIIDAANTAVEVVREGYRVPRHRFSGGVEHAIAHIEEALLHHLPDAEQRWYSVKLFERDEKIAEKLNISPTALAHIDNDIRNCEEEMDDDSESIITTERYAYIDTIVAKCLKTKHRGRMSTSDKIDHIVTNRWLALPIFALVMVTVYALSITTVGAWATDWANDGVFGDGWHLFGRWVPGIPVIVEDLLISIDCADWLQGLVLDGIVAGVGAVLGFIPQIFILFLLLAFLEGCGYMSRIAFILDRVFKKFGLSGKSFIPILIGTGCGVPGIMASRTIENQRDRRMTIITTTFIPCSAKLPIIALIAGAMFGDAWWVAPSAYFVGIAAIVCSGIILKKTKLFAGDASPFVMELPAYHLPTASSILRSTWDRGWSFVKKAGTVVLLATVFVWFAASFGWSGGRFGMVDMEHSLMATVGRTFAWMFAPLGFGKWQSAVAAITGLIAKENIVGTLGVLYSGDSADMWNHLAADFSPLSAYSFLLFNLLCAPCFAAMAAIRREMNSAKWFWFAIAYQCSFAYIVSMCIFQLGTLLGGGGFGIATGVSVALVACFVWLLFRRAAVPREEVGV